jgi:hypothetical protein
MSPSNWLARLWLVVLLAATLLPATGALADNPVEDSVKAAFILNFTKYTEWPSAQAGSDLLICSLSERPLSGKLEALQGRQVQGRTIRVRITTRPSDWRECQVFFITEDDERRIETVLRTVNQHPVLTISDTPGFVQAGGIIELKLRAGRIRFDINQGAARQVGLKLSSQLLKLADEVLP